MPGTAAELTRALAGRWNGRSGLARCPTHDDSTPSLSISEGKDSRVLVKCHAGCAQTAVIGELQARGLWPVRHERYWRPEPKTQLHQRESEAAVERRRIQGARAIWSECRPAAGTLAEVYLKARGITCAIPPSLRFHAALKHGPTNLVLPALVAGITVWPSQEVQAVHRIYVTENGRKKVAVSNPKLSLGPLGGAISS